MTDQLSTEWMERAACRGNHPALFYLDELDGVFRRDWRDKALAICRSCPVRDACLEYAIATDADGGIWGGMLPGERRAHAMRCAS